MLYRLKNSIGDDFPNDFAYSEKKYHAKNKINSIKLKSAGNSLPFNTHNNADI